MMSFACNCDPNQQLYWWVKTFFAITLPNKWQYVKQPNEDTNKFYQNLQAISVSKVYKDIHLPPKIAILLIPVKQKEKSDMAYWLHCRQKPFKQYVSKEQKMYIPVFPLILDASVPAVSPAGDIAVVV